MSGFIQSSSESTKEFVWTLVVNSSGKITDLQHNLGDPSIQSLNSLILSQSQLDGFKHVGLVVETIVVGAFTGDPGIVDQYFNPGFGLYVKVYDTVTGFDYIPSFNIGGLEYSLLTGGSPHPSVFSMPSGYLANTFYGNDVKQITCKLFTSGHPIIVGNVDVRQSSNPGLYGSGGTLNGQGIDVSSDQGSASIFFLEPTDENVLVDFINSQGGPGGVSGFINAAGRLCLFGKTNTSSGTVSITSSSIATSLGFPVTTSATNTLPNFGQLNTSVEMLVKVKVIFSANREIFA